MKKNPKSVLSMHKICILHGMTKERIYIRIYATATHIGLK